MGNLLVMAGRNENATLAWRGEPCPCDDCENKRACKANSLACHSFWAFMLYNKPNKWMGDEPQRAIFDWVYQTKQDAIGACPGAGPRPEWWPDKRGRPKNK